MKTLADAAANPVAANIDERISPELGLTKREWFAGQIMAGMCANSVPGQHKEFSFQASECIRYTDALIAELNKEQQ